MIKLVIDSTADLTAQEAKDLGVTVIPMKVCINEKEYLAGVNLDDETFFSLLKTCKNLPHTTQINQDEYINTIKPILDNGDEVFVMALSSGLSGSFNSLRLASEELNSPNLEIFDTKTVTLGYKVVVYEAVKLINKGLSLEEIKTQMETLREKCRLMAVIDNVKYLIKGGRLSLIAGIAVTALNIKPIVHIVDGKLKVLSKAIGYNNALKTLIKHINNIDLEKEISLGHSNDRKRFFEMKQDLQNNFKTNQDRIDEIGPVIGTHVGPGCFGLAYIEK